MDGCVFCEIVAGEVPASVVPDGHAARLADLPADADARMFRIAHRIAAALYESGLDCEGVNVFLADGEAAGQDVLHVHLHVIPRFFRDGFGLRFGPDYSNMPDRETWEEAAAHVRDVL